MAGADGQQIYQWLVEQKLGSESWLNSKDAVFAAVREFHAIKDEVHKLAAEVESGFQGKAGSAASRGLGPLAVVFETAAPKVEHAQDLTRAQAQTFDEVHPRIKPVPPMPAAPTGLGNLALAGDAAFGGGLIPGSAVSNYNEAIKASADAGANNVHHYTNLANATDYNTSNLPKQYGPQQAEGGKIGVGDPQLKSTGGHPVTVRPPSTGGGGSGSGSVASASGSGGQSARVSPTPHVGGTGGGSAPPGGHASPDNQGAVAQPPSVGAGSGPSAGTNTAGYAPPVEPGYTGPGTGTGAGTSPYAGTGTGAGYQGGSYGGGGGFLGGYGGGYNTTGSPRSGSGPRGAGFGEGTGPRSGSGSGPGGRGAAGSGPKGAGPRSGAGLTEEPSASGSRGTTGATGRSGSSGMPMSGAGRGKQEDKEHQRKDFLITRENGNEIVGELPPTIAPVIGEDPKPQEKKE